MSQIAHSESLASPATSPAALVHVPHHDSTMHLAKAGVYSLSSLNSHGLLTREPGLRVVLLLCTKLSAAKELG